VGALKRLSALVKDPVSGVTHLATALAAVPGLIFLLRAAPAVPIRSAALATYGASLILLFSASAAYHLIRGSQSLQDMLRRFDHSAIFILIAGSYTPICVIVLTGTLGTVLLVIIWGLAAVGILLNLVMVRKTSAWVSSGLYVLMGWLALVVVVPLVRRLPLAGLAWLLAGGLLYTGGAVIYARERLTIVPGVFDSHEVWHLFVSAAAATHYILMLRYVARI
jgi:hemolysin III